MEQSRMRQLKISKNITNRETESLDKYLQEIGKIPLITAEEEVQLAQRIKIGDKGALEKLTKANLRFVVSVAKQYQNQGLTLPDLINEGNLGVIKAAQRFDETRGFKFISYAVRRIRQSILQALAENARIVRLPLNQIRTVNKIYKAAERLEQEYGRTPTAEEIAEVLDIPEEKVEDARSHSGRSVSTDKPLDESNPDEGMLEDLLLRTDETEATDHGLYLQSLKKEIARSLATLTPRESDVIKFYFGIEQPHSYTLEEIGEKFELTRERVRQIKEKALRRLKHINKSKNLKQYLGQ